MTDTFPNDKKVFLIDAYAIIYRSYYAFMKNPRTTSTGFNTSAIFGFVNTLEELLKKENPKYIAVVFDPKGKTFRHEMYPEYKAQREKTPEDISLAIPYIKEIVKAYGITMFQEDGFEADDVIGSLAKKIQESGFVAYMITPDKDFAQLVDERIFQYRPKYGASGFDILGVEQVKEKYGIQTPLQMIDILGLMGDAADNIPGCPGVGEKTAQKLLKEFGSIENLLSNTDKLKGVLKNKVEDNREQIIFSKKLATIYLDVPLDYSIDKIAKKDVDKDKIVEIFNELEFRTLLRRKFDIDDIVPTANKKKEQGNQMSLFGDKSTESLPAENNTIIESVDSTLSSISTVSHDYFLIENDIQIDKLLNILRQQKIICFDTETTSLDIFKAELVGISFSMESHIAYYVTIPKEKTACLAILNKFKDIFEDASIGKIGQNIKFDVLILKNYGIEVRGRLFDTMIAHYLIQPEGKHGMDHMAEMDLSYRTIHFEELFGEDAGKKDIKYQLIRNVDLNLLKDYACEDADITYQLYLLYKEHLVKNNLEKLFYDIEMPLVNVLADMEYNGVLIDDFALNDFSQLLKKQLYDLEHDIYKYSGDKINIASPKQVGELLFDKLKIIDKPKKTKSGQYQTDEETLQRLKDRHPVLKLILEYRGVKKLLNTYAEALPKLISPKTGRIHTSYNQTVVATGRLSSSNPNLQNIPIRDEQGREIRKAFIAGENSVMLAADYSQIELRIMAHLSQDKHMIEAFMEGKDIHSATASKVFNTPISMVTSDMRRMAKTANFGIIYGISAFGLSQRLNVSRKEASELIDGYFASFPDVKKYMDDIIDLAKDKGFVETIFGRRRYLPDINSRNANVRKFAERNAINAPIQGTAADIIKLAMINVHNKLTSNNLQTKMLLQVHDELVFDVPKVELEQVKNIIKHEMESVISLSVPLIVDIGVGQNWLEAH